MFSRKQILDAVNQEYPDGYLSNYYTTNGQFCQSNGDTLAEFIVREVTEVCDDQSDVVIRTNSIRDRLEAGIDDLFGALAGLKALHNQIPGHEDCWGDDEDEGD